MPRQNFSKIETIPENDLKKIQSLARNGYSFKYIFQWLQETGFKIAEKTVQNWHKKYLESIANDDIKAKEALSAINKQQRDTTPDPLIDNPEDLERIRKEWDIKDLNSLVKNELDEGTDWDIIASQKMITDLFFDAGILTKNRLNLYKEGLAKFPCEQIKSMKLIYDMYYQIMQVADRNSAEQAIKTLDRLEKLVANYKKYGLIKDDIDDIDDD